MRNKFFLSLLFLSTTNANASNVLIDAVNASAYQQIGVFLQSKFITEPHSCKVRNIERVVDAAIDVGADSWESMDVMVNYDCEQFKCEVIVQITDPSRPNTSFEPDYITPEFSYNKFNYGIAVRRCEANELNDTPPPLHNTQDLPIDGGASNMIGVGMKTVIDVFKSSLTSETR